MAQGGIQPGRCPACGKPLSPVWRERCEHCKTPFSPDLIRARMAAGFNVSAGAVAGLSVPQPASGTSALPIAVTTYQCPHCSRAIPGDASFCPSCGGRLSMAAPSVGPAAHAAPPGAASTKRNPMQLVVAVVVAAAVLYLVSGRGSGQPSGVPTAQATPTPVVPSTPRAGATPAGASSAAVPLAFPPIELTGRGDRVVKFTIPVDTPAIAKATHSGSSNFAVVALAADGSSNDLLINEIGKYSGTVLFDEDVGVHTVAFEVTASGSWTITVKPITSARKWDGATKLSGKGDDVVLMDPPTGLFETATIKHAGESNFAVIAYASDGSDLIVNEIGSYTGQVVLPDATLLFEVTADGSWTIAID